MKIIITLILLWVCSSLNADEEHKVTWVVDGDTIKIQTGEFVRYIGIDTPEIRKKVFKKWKYDPEPMSKEAKRFNMKLVKGEKVRLEFDVTRKDRYKRLLAYVYVGETFVNLELVRQGYAKLLTIPPNVKYTDEFKRALKEAKKNKRGIWRQ